MTAPAMTHSKVNVSAPAVDSNSPTGPVLKIVNGHPVVSSLDVAKHFEKRHDHLLRSIKAIIRNAPESFGAPNFGETYIEIPMPNEGGMKRIPIYEMTRDGFTVLVMGFTGKKAIAWKITYVQAFNAMEAALAAKPDPTGTLAASQQQEIKELVQAKASAYPDAAKRKVYSQIWTRLQRKFKVPRYEELPASLFGEARDYVIAMQIRSVEAPALEEAQPKALPGAASGCSIRDYAWFYPGLPETPDMWRRLSFRAADAFERFGKEIDAIKAEAFRPFRENRRSGVATFFDEAMSPNHALFKIVDDQMRVAYRCIYEALDGLIATYALLRKG